MSARRIQTSLFKFDMWSSSLETDIDEVRAMMDTYNVLTLVAAVIASIQGRIISFTMTLPRNHLGRSSNIFAFAGLMLDIIGTFSGVIHVLVMQRRVNRSTALLNFVTESKTMTGTRAANRQGADDQLLSFGIMGQNALSQREVFLENEMRLYRESMPFRYTPLILIGLGIRALVISIILFAAEADSPAAEMWISCAVVLFTFMACSLVPFSYSSIKHRITRRNS